ncbi:hypothetical protein MTP99_013925 [Tenebrio molitor]|nr:hypothetical protein MTP99_013925 [Tenebrio molitor]
MPKVISAYEKGCIKRCFSEYKKGRPDFTNDDIFKRLSHIFGVNRNSIIDILKQDLDHLESSFCSNKPKTEKR